MYTTAQQTHIDGLVRDAYARAYDKACKVLTEASEAKLEPIKARLAETYEHLRVMAITSAASELEAVDASQVAVLMDGAIRVDEDDGSLFVVDAKGERRFSKDGSPITVKEAVADYLFVSPHLVGPKPLHGTGSQRAEGFLVGYSRVIKRQDYDRLSPEIQMEKVFDGVRIVN